VLYAIEGFGQLHNRTTGANRYVVLKAGSQGVHNGMVKPLIFVVGFVTNPHNTGRQTAKRFTILLGREVAKQVITQLTGFTNL
jgi:hypothetical protein